MAAAFSSVPPFFRYTVMLVARKVWLPINVLIAEAKGHTAGAIELQLSQ